MNYKKPHYLTGKRWVNLPNSAKPRQWLLSYDWCHYCSVDGQDFSDTLGMWMWKASCGRTSETFRIGKANSMDEAMRAAEEAYIDAEMSK